MLTIGLAIVALVAVTVDLDSIEQHCGERPLACNVVAGATTSALTAALVSFVWVNGFARSTALRRYRRSLVLDPGRAMGANWAAQARHLLGRDRFTSDVVLELQDTRKSEPIIVAGSPGAGKSSILVLLASRLARSGFVPVLVPLRGRQFPLDLRHLVLESLRSELARQGITESTIERICLSVLRSGRLVGLLDGLDEVDPAVPITRRQIELDSALDTARTGLRTVATSRHSVLSKSLRAALFEVPPLSVEDSTQIAGAGGKQRDNLEAIIRAGQLNESPLFLPLVSRLQGEIDLSQTPDAVRLRLLSDAYATIPEDVQYVLGALAASLMHAGKYEGMLEDALHLARQEDPSLTEFAARSALDAGQSHDVTDAMVTDSGVRFTFRHSHLATYFLAQFLNARPDGLRLLKDAALPEVSQSITWAAPPSEALDWMDRATRQLDASNALVACVRIASTHRAQLPPGIVELDRHTDWHDPVLEFEFVAGLQGLVKSWQVVAVLAARERHPSYDVRWQAGRVLASGDQETYRLTKPYIEQRMQDLHDCALMDVDPMSIQEGPLWYLPGLAAGCQGDPAAWQEASTQLDVLDELVHLAAMNGIAGAPGAESSLAQGYKLAALTRPGVIDQTRTARLALRGRFWYARIEALQALAYEAIARAAGPVPALEQARLKEPNPLVRAIAQLASEAVRERRTDLHLWADEFSMLRASETGLTDEAFLALAELVLLLNLSLNAPQAQRDANALAQDLPPCMKRAADRTRLTSAACDSVCGFKLCPYDSVGLNQPARGIFSEAFIRRLIRIVERNSPPTWYEGSRSSYLTIWESFLP